MDLPFLKDWHIEHLVLPSSFAQSFPTLLPPGHAYLPDNEKGRWVLNLQTAFERGLILPVVTSHTSGPHNVMTWNGINHKTVQIGFEFRYPDAYYRDRVLAELGD